ncbi:hypothetical protein [Lichenihabitans psoromatis]|uniref:hypothetical protein n=1 Tax=Lichenihabitans psoromatis TaxID=2528642 RepID=UPI001036D1E8|nr:hypothetical protein [Lichenihabitans psoromatis]
MDHQPEQTLASKLESIVQHLAAQNVLIILLLSEVARDKDRNAAFITNLDAKLQKMRESEGETPALLKLEVIAAHARRVMSGLQQTAEPASDLINLVHVAGQQPRRATRPR